MQTDRELLELAASAVGFIFNPTVRHPAGGYRQNEGLNA